MQACFYVLFYAEFHQSLDRYQKVRGKRANEQRQIYGTRRYFELFTHVRPITPFKFFRMILC